MPALQKGQSSERGWVEASSLSGAGANRAFSVRSEETAPPTPGGIGVRKTDGPAGARTARVLPHGHLLCPQVRRPSRNRALCSAGLGARGCPRETVP